MFSIHRHSHSHFETSTVNPTPNLAKHLVTLDIFYIIITVSYQDMDILQDKISKIASELMNFEKNHSIMKVSAGLIGTYTLFKCTSFIWKYYLRPSLDISSKYSGTWAIITGASAGIGFRIAHELAAKGVNIILVARNKERLIAAKTEILSCYPSIEIRIVSLDAEKFSDLSPILDTIKDIKKVSFLINNVGVHNTIPTTVEDMKFDEVQRIIHVNCNFQVQLTAAMIPHLKLYSQTKSPTQGQPTILNISSLTSRIPMPLLSVYAGSKAFEEHWTECLAGEVEVDGIQAMCLRPGLTVSAMSGETVASFFCPTAETMAKACVRMIGSGEVSVVPYPPHALLDWLNTLMPQQISRRIARDMHVDKRLKLLEKLK